MLPDCSWIQQEQSGKVVTRLLVALASTSLVREADSSTNQSCPRTRGKCCGVSRDERGTAQSCQAVLPFPPQLRLRSAAPPQAVAPLGAVQARRTVPYPFAERSFQWGYGGLPGGLRGEIEIFPGPLAKRIIKLLIVLYLTPSVSPTARHLPRQGGFGVHFISFSLVIPRCRADMQANYCLHLIFMIYLKVKLPQGVRHAKAAYC